jgi:ABC-type polysaccharide/polyol phosphate export permease
MAAVSAKRLGKLVSFILFNFFLLFPNLYQERNTEHHILQLVHLNPMHINIANVWNKWPNSQYPILTIYSRASQAGTAKDCSQ